MKWKKWLENWDMTSLKIKTPFLEMDWNPQEKDKDAAWEMYIELLTRITTQSLEYGDEKSALDSIYSLFPLTREIIKRHGRDCGEFTKISIVILNQKIRPFTEKWHYESLNKAFEDEKKCKKFRKELKELQEVLITFTKMLGDMAGVEDDLTQINKKDNNK